jgi:hypothetical protein
MVAGDPHAGGHPLSSLFGVDEAARGQRRAQARRRAQIQRRRIVAAACAGAVLLIAVLALASLGGEGRAGDGKAGGAPGPPPELPRGGRSIFPEFRVVAFAGAPQAEELGALGIGTLDEAARKLERQAAPYARGRGRRPILPAFELIAVIANGTPGDDGKYRSRQKRHVVANHLEAARRARALLLLDVQPGQADFMEEVRQLDEFLAQPDVSLALDPEWHMGEGGVPGETIGSVTAEEVNEVSAHLSRIVAHGRLPEKLLVVHQFTGDMIENRRRLRHYPGVALTLNVDGFGDRQLKVDKYNDFGRKRDRAHHGFKLFYSEDTGLMEPSDVLRLRPEPEFVVYE